MTSLPLVATQYCWSRQVCPRAKLHQVILAVGCGTSGVPTTTARHEALNFKKAPQGWAALHRVGRVEKRQGLVPMCLAAPELAATGATVDSPGVPFNCLNHHHHPPTPPLSPTNNQPPTTNHENPPPPTTTPHTPHPTPHPTHHTTHHPTHHTTPHHTTRMKHCKNEENEKQNH